MGFSGSDLATLDYDFTTAPSVNGGMCVGKGIIPEPSDKAILKFRTAIHAVTMQIERLAQGEEFGADFQDVTDGVDPTEYVLGLVAELCQDKPSVVELTNLSPRTLTAFISWLMGELVPKG